MGHCFSSRSDDDTSKYRRFGIMLVADPDYVLALYPYHTIPYRLTGPVMRAAVGIGRFRVLERVVAYSILLFHYLFIDLIRMILY